MKIKSIKNYSPPKISKNGNIKLSKRECMQIKNSRIEETLESNSHELIYANLEKIKSNERN